ncbi:hypothetical protein SKAU_G00005360 [Synaphobranchus kaupii]|uniref:Uncharacterized protein n=1 Tax=Synaphobranchus kaupii TaxID=118154 RepID=A0A9Q1GA29_SYNKA|nr:hypothetical protein SKAU_G00005360 [Synaphobranchus kaupii]
MKKPCLLRRKYFVHWYEHILHVLQPPPDRRGPAGKNLREGVRLPPRKAAQRPLQEPRSPATPPPAQQRRKQAARRDSGFKKRNLIVSDRQLTFGDRLPGIQVNHLSMTTKLTVVFL